MARITNPNEGRFTKNAVPLKNITSFFEPEQMKEAYDYAGRIRSYVGIAYDNKRELIGFYVPA